MERLQAAIEKAREQRGQNRPAERATTATKPRQPETTGVDEAWDKLPLIKWTQRHLQRKRVVGFQPGPESASFDMLRTRVLQLAAEHGWRRIAVTSPDKAAGKSTVCCNLLASLSRQEALRTILIDFDMKRPALASLLGHKGDWDVSDILTEKTTFAEQAVRVAPNAAVSMSYRPRPNSAELLFQKRTEDIIRAIEETYKPDLMLFDMPPLLVTDDALAFMTKVDGALLVAGAGTTTIEQIDSSEKEIAEHTNFLGVVLNKCKFMTSGYGYSYY